MHPTGHGMGFTLVELLVVVAIIAILLALLTPSLDKAIEYAERAVCASHQHQFGLANQMYSLEFRKTFVPIKTAGVPESPASADPINPGNPTNYVSPNGDYDPWFHNKHYATIMGVTGSYNDNVGLSPEPTWSADGLCPTTAPDRLRNGRTAIRSSLAFNWSNINNGNFTEQPIVIRRTSIAYPSETVQMVDANDWHTFGRRWRRADYTAYWDLSGDTRNAPALLGMVTYRHNEGANIHFFDGSVTYLHKTAAWRFADADAGVPDDGYNSRRWDINPDKYVNP